MPPEDPPGDRETAAPACPWAEFAGAAAFSISAAEVGGGAQGEPRKRHCGRASGAQPAPTAIGRIGTRRAHVPGT